MSSPRRKLSEAADGDDAGQVFRQGLIDVLPHLRAFARGLCGRTDRADDLVQEAVMRAWAARGSFALGTNLKAWIFTIARNTFLNELRRNRRESQLEDGQAEAVLITAADQENGLHMTDLQRALDSLPADRREALLLVGASGFTYEEAAKVCDVAVGTMKSRVSRARAQLGALLDAESAADGPPA